MAVKKVEESKIVRAKKERSGRKALASNALKVTNHMRCPWIVPPEIMKGQTKKDVSKIDERAKLFSRKQKIVAPNETIIVDRGGFNAYYSKSRAFQALIDKKHIVATKRTLPQEMLRSVDPAKAPPELQPTDGHTSLSLDKIAGPAQMKGLTLIGH